MCDPIFRNVISTWSSGTGGAGIVGSTSYALMIGAGLEPATTLFLMCIVPVLEAVAFWGILRHNNHIIVVEEKRPSAKSSGIDNAAAVSDSNKEINGEDSRERSRSDVENVDSGEQLEPLVGFKSKLRYIPSLLKYIVPLTLVYFLEYFINQGLVSLAD